MVEGGGRGMKLISSTVALTPNIKDVGQGLTQRFRNARSLVDTMRWGMAPLLPGQNDESSLCKLSPRSFGAKTKKIVAPLTPHVAGVANQPPQSSWVGAKLTKNYGRLFVSYSITTTNQGCIQWGGRRLWPTETVVIGDRALSRATRYLRAFGT